MSGWGSDAEDGVGLPGGMGVPPMLTVLYRK